MVTDADGRSEPTAGGTTTRSAAPANVPADIAALPFDAALDEFQRTVAALEAGGQPLEEALALYERGVALHAHLDRLLTDAELRIRRLVERAGGGVETGDLRSDEVQG
jgi:exodeoxyribonuclease VII small subunit